MVWGLEMRLPQYDNWVLQENSDIQVLVPPQEGEDLENEEVVVEAAHDEPTPGSSDPRDVDGPRPESDQQRAEQPTEPSSANAHDSLASTPEEN